MKTIRIFALLCVAALSSLGLKAAEEKDFVGTWECVRSAIGNESLVSIYTFNEDGTYTLDHVRVITTSAASDSSNIYHEGGTWSLHGKRLVRKPKASSVEVGTGGLPLAGVAKTFEVMRKVEAFTELHFQKIVSFSDEAFTIKEVVEEDYNSSFEEYESHTEKVTYVRKQ